MLNASGLIAFKERELADRGDLVKLEAGTLINMASRSHRHEPVAPGRPCNAIILRIRISINREANKSQLPFKKLNPAYILAARGLGNRRLLSTLQEWKEYVPNSGLAHV